MRVSSIEIRQSVVTVPQPIVDLGSIGFVIGRNESLWPKGYRDAWFSLRIKAGPVIDDLSIYSLRPAADGIVKGTPICKEISLGISPGCNSFVSHVFTYRPRTA